MCSMPSRASARPTWVGCWRSGALPDVGVWTAPCARSVYSAIGTPSCSSTARNAVRIADTLSPPSRSWAYSKRLVASSTTAMRVNHRWLALLPEQWFTLIAVVDDATNRLLYAQLREGGESVAAILTALRAVLEHDGVPMALYTDRAHWAVHTPTSGSAPDRQHPTQVGRALARLGIEHILGYSPQARGRSERANRTLQDRLVNELRLAGITTVAVANRYLRERFLPSFNAEFARPPADPVSAFVPLGGAELDQILCVEDERVVGRDNVVTADRVPLQVAKQPGRRTCAGLRVLVRRHLNGQHSVWHGTRCLGRYDRAGHPLRAA